ncbi:MAG: hypothetical protein AB1551_08060 [Actinomycetota bacterium]
MRSPLVRSIAVALAVLVLAACSSEESRLTKDELITQADAICKTAMEEIGTLGQDLGMPTEENMPQWADELGELLSVFEDMTSQLKDLNPPEADQGMWDQITAGLDQEVGALDTAQQAAEDGDVTGMSSALMEINTVDEKITQLATDYGFKQCGAESSEEGTT